MELPSVVKKYKGIPAATIKEELDSAFHRFNAVRKENLRLFDGVKETLELLNERGVTIIGYTESSQENGYYRLKRLGIVSLFKRVYVSSSQYYIDSLKVNKQVMIVPTKKPNKEVLLNICDREKCSPQDAIYIGDSLTKDILMAKMANITSVWVNYIKEPNNYYNDLVEISSWSDEDFRREAEFKRQIIEKRITPDYTIGSFTDLLEIVLNS